MDLMEENENVEQIRYQYLCDKITGDYPNYGPAAKYGIIDTWIRKTMIYQNIGLVQELNVDTKGLKSSIMAATFGLSDTVCYIWSGTTGKKQVDTRKFFEYVNKELQEKKGLEMYQLPVETFQYILTCLQYLGFSRKEKTGAIQKVDVSQITYEEL
jgi:hypothetical protein